MISHTRQEWFELAAFCTTHSLTWPADVAREGEIK